MPVTSNARRARHRRLGYLLGPAMLVAGIAAGAIVATGTAQAAVPASPGCPVTTNAATALLDNGQPNGGTELSASAGCPNLTLTYVDATATYQGWLRAASGGRWVACHASLRLTKGPVRATLCTDVVPGARIKVVGPPGIHVRYDAVQAAARVSGCPVARDAATALLDRDQPTGGTELSASAGCPNLTLTYVDATATYQGWLRAASGGRWVACHASLRLTRGPVRATLCTGVVPGALMKVAGPPSTHVRYDAET